MFCPNCGSPIDEEAIFCPNCGKNIAETQEIPAAPEAVAPASEVSEIPFAPETVVLTPDANPWAQPEEPAADPFAQVSFDEKPAKPKKKLWKILAPIVAVVAVVAILVACFADGLTGFFLKTFGDDKSYSVYVEEKSFEQAAATVTDAYGKYISASQMSQAVTTDLKLNVSEDALDMLSAQLGANLDLGWINDVVFRIDGNTKDGLTSGNFILEISQQTILDLAMFMDMDASAIILGVQNLSDQFVALELDSAEMEPGFDLLKDGKLMAALPSEKVLNSLLNKYFAIILENIDQVESADETLTVGNISQKVTAIKATIDSESLCKIAKAVLQAAAEDKDLETIICNVAKVLQDAELIENADEVYSDFKDGINEALEDLDEEELDDDKVVITTYVDGSHNVIGRKLEAEDQTISYATATDGDKFASKIDLGTAQINGAGTKNGNKVNAEYTLTAEDMAVLTLKATDFVMEKDSISGKLLLNPTDELLGTMDLDDQTASVVKALDLGLALDLSCNENKASVTLSVISKGDPMISIIANSEMKQPQSVTLPDDSKVLSMDEAEQWLQSFDFDKLIGALEKTSIPADLVDQLENLLGMVA